MKNESKEASKKSIPTHIGIIIDGNRRWAREHGLTSFEGHSRGYERLKEVGEWCLELGIKHLTIFGFSTENWKRASEEVGYLMDLFYRAVTSELGYFDERGIRLRIAGSRLELTPKVALAFDSAEQKTRANTRGTLTLAINYGGRQEILSAVRDLITSGIKAENVSEASLSALLSASAGVPDPELIIRTSGEQRLSGFLTWQSVYSELYFEPKHWPDFDRATLLNALDWYATRDRRMGK